MGQKMKLKTRLNRDFIEKYTKAGYWTNKTLGEYLDEAVMKCPDREAAVDRDRRVNYRQLGKMVERMALGLLELGLKTGDVISFQLPNWLETIVIHHAVSKIGAITNPILPIYRTAEVKYILEHTASRLLIIPHRFRKRDYVTMVEGIRTGLPHLKDVLVIDGNGLPQGMSSFETFMGTPWEDRRNPKSLSEIKPDPNNVMLIMFTSGTEAEPKGVLHTYNTLNRECRSAIDAWQLGEEDVFFMPGPVTHIGGLLYGLELPQILGAKVVFMDEWNPDIAVKVMDTEGCTWTGGATPFLMGILRSPSLSEHSISSLRVFGCGGAGVPPSLIRDFASRFPGCRTGRGYGSTEYPTVSINYFDSPLDKAAETDGLPAEGTEVKIVDEDNREVPTGGTGEIVVRGPECFVGYLNSALNKKYFDEDGWFHTGDLGRVDEEGYVEVTGRKKDIIIRGGENISAKELEDVLFTHPNINEVAVVGMPDPVMQERACAYVVPKPGESIGFEEMISFLERKKMAKQKYPERLELVNAFPTTSSGKVQKFILRQDIRGKLKKEGEGRCGNERTI
jgi:cyclohexanecarboxylate-CoA ligase